MPVVFFDYFPDFDSYNKVCSIDDEAAFIAVYTIIHYNKGKGICHFW
jgi:hypothetical protein